MLYSVNKGLKARGRWPSCDARHRRREALMLRFGVNQEIDI